MLFHMTNQYPDHFKMFSKLSDEQKKAHLTTDERGPSPLPQKSGLTSPTSSTGAVSAQFLWHPNATDINLFLSIRALLKESSLEINSYLIPILHPQSSFLMMKLLVDNDLEAFHQRVGLVIYHTRQCHDCQQSSPFSRRMRLMSRNFILLRPDLMLLLLLTCAPSMDCKRLLCCNCAI